MSNPSPEQKGQGGLLRRTVLADGLKVVTTIPVASLLSTTPLSIFGGVERAEADGEGSPFIEVDDGIFYIQQESETGHIVRRPMATVYKGKGADATLGKPISSAWVDDQEKITQAFEKAIVQISPDTGEGVLIKEYDSTEEVERVIPLQNRSMFRLIDGKPEPLASPIVVSADKTQEDVIISRVSFQIGDTVPEIDKKYITDGIMATVKALRTFASYEPIGLVVFAYHEVEQTVLAQMNRLKYLMSTFNDNLKRWSNGEAESDYRSIFLYTGNLWQRQPPLRRLATPAHEGYHTLQRELVKKSVGSPPDTYGPAGPIWLTEGGAECFAFRAVTIDDPNVLKNSLDEAVRYATRYKVPLRSLETPNGFVNATPDAGGGYGLTRLGVEFLVNNTPGGFRALTHYYDLIGNGRPWDQAFHIAMGRDIDTFYEQYDRYVNSGYKLDN